MGSSSFNWCECGNGGAKCIDCHAKRMKAATCKCGHVGAECFNDSYCTPDPTDRITELEDELNWRDMEQETDDATIQQQTTRITELETTIRVLAGLLNG